MYSILPEKLWAEHTIIEKPYFVDSHDRILPTYNDIEEVNDYLKWTSNKTCILGLRNAQDYKNIKYVCNISLDALDYCLDNNLLDMAVEIANPIFLTNCTQQGVLFIKEHVPIQEIIIYTKWENMNTERLKIILNTIPELLEYPELFNTHLLLQHIKVLLELNCKYEPQQLLFHITCPESFEYIKDLADITEPLSNLKITPQLYTKLYYCTCRKNCVCLSGNFLHYFNDVLGTFFEICEYIHTNYPVIFAKLINTQDDNGNTPLHRYYQTIGDELDERVPKLCIQGGFDTKIVNSQNLLFFGMSANLFEQVK